MPAKTSKGSSNAEMLHYAQGVLFAEKTICASSINRRPDNLKNIVFRRKPSVKQSVSC